MPEKTTSKKEYARIIALWLAVFMLVIFSYQLGMYNIHATEKFIEKTCSESALNYSAGFDGSVGFWKDIPEIEKNITVP